jgi:hypothetical protein
MSAGDAAGSSVAFCSWRQQRAVAAKSATDANEQMAQCNDVGRPRRAHLRARGHDSDTTTKGGGEENMNRKRKKTGHEPRGEVRKPRGVGNELVDEFRRQVRDRQRDQSIGAAPTNRVRESPTAARVGVRFFFAVATEVGGHHARIVWVR